MEIQIGTKNQTNSNKKRAVYRYTEVGGFINVHKVAIGAVNTGL